MACQTEGDSCANGQGLCTGNLTLICSCLDPAFADQGDFVRSSGCRIHRPTFLALWILNSIAWIATAIAAILALILLKRKNTAVHRFEQRHICVALAASLCVSTLCLLELSQSATLGGVAVDPATSIMYALSQVFCWFTLLLKPSRKTETSISAVMMGLSPKIRAGYQLSSPLVLIFMLAATACVISAAFLPSNDDDVMGTAYFSINAAGFSVVTINLTFATCLGRKHLGNALSKSAVVSTRISVRLRMEKFAKRAIEVMVASIIATLLILALNLILGLCSICRQRAFWALLPVMTIMMWIWIVRAMMLSIMASRRNWRQEETERSHRLHELKSGDDEPNAPQSPPQERMYHKKPSDLSLKRKKAAAKKALMTVVVEGEYEGTVAPSQMESVLSSPTPRGVKVEGAGSSFTKASLSAPDENQETPTSSTAGF